MKKMGKLMVGLLLTTVLVMAVLGCENPASGGGETAKPLLGKWVAKASDNSVIRHYNFTETILKITETVPLSTNTMSFAGERANSQNIIYEGSYTVDSSNAEKLTFSYKITSTENTVKTTFTFSTSDSGEKTFNVEATTTTNGVETVETFTGKEAKLADLIGTWEIDFDMVYHPVEGSPFTSIVYKGYHTFQETYSTVYMTSSMTSDVLPPWETKVWTPEQEFDYAFNGSTATITMSTGEVAKLTFNTKTSGTLEMPPDDMISPGFPTSITYTKINNPIIPKHSLIGTWKTNANANEYVFTENTINIPGVADTQSMVAVMEMDMSGQSSSAMVEYGNPQNIKSIDFIFTDATKTAFKIQNMDNSLGADIYTKQ